MARLVKEALKVLAVNRRSALSMTAMSTSMSFEVQADMYAISERLPATASGLMSPAEMCSAAWLVVALLSEYRVVTTAGPHALSRIRSAQ